MENEQPRTAFFFSGPPLHTRVTFHPDAAAVGMMDFIDVSSTIRAKEAYGEDGGGISDAPRTPRATPPAPPRPPVSPDPPKLFPTRSRAEPSEPPTVSGAVATKETMSVGKAFVVFCVGVVVAITVLTIAMSISPSLTGLVVALALVAFVVVLLTRSSSRVILPRSSLRTTSLKG